ncbi:MAG: hypothetical protein PUK85_05695 [Clostridia bacterium]|nr:hypothetical protein [Clostridia bacterium]
MKANKKAIRLAMARACVGRKEISERAGMPEMTVKNVLDGRSVKPATLGKVSRALGVDPLEIMEQEE